MSDHQFANFEDGVPFLPPYSRSLLKIKVPVAVKLVETTQPVSRILDLALGTILQLDKSCEDTLSLQVGDEDIAEGEVVKVGDRFGLRITSITLPKERFVALGRPTTPQSTD